VPRAFNRALRSNDIEQAHAAANKLWGICPQSWTRWLGGGSIPLESARLGFSTVANEYNPIACSVLEATLDYPFRFGPELAERARHWGRVWEGRTAQRLGRFFPKDAAGLVHAYIFARTVPCPSTGHMTPLVPDWHLLKPKGGIPIVAVPLADKASGTWTVDIRPVGTGPGHVKEAPRRTYTKGKGESLFTREPIPPEWIKEKARLGQMGSALYAVALKTPRGLKFRPPVAADFQAIAAGEDQLRQVRKDWEARNLIPSEIIPAGSKTREPLSFGIRSWAEMFSPRQLLVFGVLTEELRALQPKIIAREGDEIGEAVVHILAFVIDKFANYNDDLASWHSSHQVIRSIFDRHDFSFKPTFTEMAPVAAESGLDWAITSTIKAYEDIAELPRDGKNVPIGITQGSATSLIELPDHSLDAVVVDPP
jgi:adenine-specific DNA methylase